MRDYDNLLIALRRINRAISIQSKKLMRETGYTAAQLLVLQVAEGYEAVSPGYIAKELSLSAATVSSLVDRLERAGAVRRERSDTDGRSRVIVLTEKGRAQLNAAPELLQAEFLKKYRELNDWERNMLLSSVQRVASMMDAEELDASPILDVGELDS